ncbi:response regulator transcription factor [Paenibacillus sp. MMS20-IR301]|uniref:response regulator transcription factor n=1 Tax=Paenibacillus sp. MMS20-IR301 TaxID=2895946 RepID=UPI0028EC4F99|nr:response regulator transcription factor [Paenibacillus sp. MMS20-IR301]WNS44080.1 response regulator transcription factor [Paenibacillus sp. MMS20-IR301]
MASERIMIVEDEPEIAELIKDYLEIERYEVLICPDGEEALRSFSRFRPQLILLDIMLPLLDGMEVCRRIRTESDIPIIMLSAKKRDSDKILGLGLGADDYVVKPFSPSEIVARVKAQLRRFNGLNLPSRQQDTVVYPGLELDLKAYEVRVRNEIVHFPAREFEVLRFLAAHPNQVFTREQIFGNAWGGHEYGDLNTVTVHIKKIREKIETDPANPRYILTIRGIGYKFHGGI